MLLIVISITNVFATNASGIRASVRLSTTTMVGVESLPSIRKDDSRVDEAEPFGRTFTEMSREYHQCYENVFVIAWANSHRMP